MTDPTESDEQKPHDEAAAVRLGRFFPLGMVAGGVAGAVVGWITHRPGICIPVGVALGILLAGTLPVFMRRR